ncbi:MAG: hypothetical protein JWO75_2444 [Actinomycetia bacterium]|nr:hypothetical protein [Actinomycetes bacterium]
MAKQFDPRKVLIHLSKPLLRAFFAPRPTFQELEWDSLPDGDIKPIYDKWLALPPSARREVQLVLQDINELADPAGLAFLAEEIQWRCPKQMQPFAAVQGHADKALWTYLNVPLGFKEAALFARTKALSTGRYWEKRNGLPQKKLEVSDELKKALGDSLVAYYSEAQGRGFKHHVEHYTRATSAEYFFVYLDDYPDNQPGFDDAGEFRRRPGQSAFDNVFVYNATDGTLELFAHGGRKVHDELQKCFCRATHGIEVEPEPPSLPVYRLDELKNPAFAFPTNLADQIAEVRIRSLRVEPVDTPRRSILLKADPKGPKDDIHQAIDLYLSATNLPRAKMRVTTVTLQLTFMSDGAAKAKTMTFDISHPSSCNLKSKPDEMRAIGERCLKLWGITQ